MKYKAEEQGGNRREMVGSVYDGGRMCAYGRNTERDGENNNCTIYHRVLTFDHPCDYMKSQVMATEGSTTRLMADAYMQYLWQICDFHSLPQDLCANK